MDCVFCRIVEGSAESYKVYEDDSVVVILDKYPASKGHLLVISRDHYESASKTPPPIVSRAFLVAAGLAKYYREELGAPGVNILANDGAQAGQMIFHFHVHVIPRWRGDPLSFHGRREISPEEAREVLSMLGNVQEYLAKYQNNSV